MFNTALKPATASAPVKKILTMFAIASLLAVVLGLATTMANPSPAQAAPKVSVSGTPKADGESSLDLSGSGFQSVKNGFGGVYVLFGWVDDTGGSWRPSKGGATGTDYRYVYDDETNPTGYQVFVTFPGSSTAEAANGGELASSGTWNATIRLPGSKFTTVDRSQNETQVDCTEVQCGIITIGAHGVTNANNESFTPVDFSAAGTDGGGDSKDKESGDDGKNDESAKQDDVETTDTETTDAETTDAETTDAETTDEKNAEPAAAAGGSDAVSPDGTSDQAQAVAPVVSEPPMSTSWLIFFAILAGALVLGSIIAIGLGFGIGGYLAAKSLLLGVSPAAMEKERDRREKKRIRTKHKLQKRRIKMQRRKKLQLAKLERGSERAVAQSTHQGAGTGKLPPQVIAFFQDEKTAGGEAARGWMDPTGAAPAHAAADPAEERATRVMSTVPADNTETTTLPTTKS